MDLLFIALTFLEKYMSLVNRERKRFAGPHFKYIPGTKPHVPIVRPFDCPRSAFSSRVALLDPLLVTFKPVQVRFGPIECWEAGEHVFFVCRLELDPETVAWLQVFYEEMNRVMEVSIEERPILNPHVTFLKIPRAEVALIEGLKKLAPISQLDLATAALPKVTLFVKEQALGYITRDLN